MKIVFRLFVGVVCLGFSTGSYGATFQVDPMADNDCGDFICDLQSALTASQNNGEDDTLNLAAGEYDASAATFTYVPTENRSLTVNGAGSDSTFLDGGGLMQVFSIDTTGLVADSGADIIFQGISIQNGNSMNPGAGLFIFTNDADITVENCDFQFNETLTTMSQFGAGGGLAAAANGAGSVTVTGSHFSNNSSPFAGAGGAFMVSVGASVLLEGNTFENNTAIDDISQPPASTFAGGAVAVAVYGDLLVQGNLFQDNKAMVGAGGLLTVTVYGTGTAVNNVIVRNSLLDPSLSMAPFAGGAGYLAISPYASFNLTNNTITENDANSGAGGGLAAVLEDESAADLTITNNIIWGNKGAGENFCTTPCNDIAIDDDFDSSNTGATVNISYSDFSDVFFKCDSVMGCSPNHQVDMATVLNVNPVFAQPLLGDYHLADTSPLINMGDPLAPGLPPVDFGGAARDQGGAPDMGAFESSAQEPPVAEDCDNQVDDDQDGATDCDDLACVATPLCQGAGAEAEGGSGGCSLAASTGQGTLLPLLAMIFILMTIRKRLTE